MACFLHQTGKPLPGVAPVAMQMGAYAAGLIQRRLAGQPPRAVPLQRPGSMATIGRAAAVADLGWMRLSRLSGLAGVAVRPSDVPDRVRQPRHGDVPVGVELFHARSVGPADHRDAEPAEQGMLNRGDQKSTCPRKNQPWVCSSPRKMPGVPLALNWPRYQ